MTYHLGGPPVAGNPLPAGVDAAPPYALGTFIGQRQGVQDRSAGSLLVFLVPNLFELASISLALRTSPQFRRMGPGTAALLQIQPQDPLVKFVVLTSLNSVEQQQPGFNVNA